MHACHHLTQSTAAVLFHFQIDRSLGAKPQTVLTHGKAKQQQILLMWKWNYWSCDRCNQISLRRRNQGINGAS